LKVLFIGGTGVISSACAQLCVETGNDLWLLNRGKSFHITSDEVLTWNQVYENFADAVGIKPNIVHIPSDTIGRFDKDWGESLSGDKAHSMIFNNSKIRRLVPNFRGNIPFSTGAREIIDWYDADTSRQVIDPKNDKLMDLIIQRFESMTAV